MSGALRGPLDGIPIAHKDIYSTAGIRTTAHSKLLEHNVPDARRPHGEEVGRRGHRDAGQAGDARVRLRRPVLRPAMAAGAQSLEHGALHGRLVFGHGRGRRRRPHPGRHRLRHRRLDPRTGGALRHRRDQADLRPIEPDAASCRSPSRSITPGPMAWTAEDCALAAAGHGRPRSGRPGQRRSAGAGLHRRARQGREGIAHRRGPPLLRDRTIARPTRRARASTRRWISSARKAPRSATSPCRRPPTTTRSAI